SRAEGKVEAAQQRPRLVVAARRGAYDHVHAPHLVDLVVVDLREHDVLPQPQGEVAAPVEALGVEAAEVLHPRQGDRHQPVDELVHAVAAQGDLGADRHAVAYLVGGDRLARARDHRTLAGDAAEIARRRVHLLAVVDGLAHAHVEHDLLDPGDLHAVLVAELLGELLAHHRLVVRLHARTVVLGAGRARHLLGGLGRALVPGCALALPGRALLALGGLAAAVGLALARRLVAVRPLGRPVGLAGLGLL